MTTTASINNVLILTGDAEGNLGDKAILQSTCNELFSVNPELSISIISRTPPPLPGKQNIHTVRPGIRGFFQLIHAARHADIILCGGGGLFQDDDSLIKMPYWALRLLLMRMFCNNIIGYSLGVGPLSAPTSRLFARLAFSCMQHISTRDPIARNTAQKLTRKPVTIVPDPALLLPSLPEHQVKDFLAAQGINDLSRPLIGVAVRRWFPAKARIIPNKISARFRRKNKTAVKQSERLCKLFAKVLDQLVIKHDATIIFMPTYNVSHESDDELCRDIQHRMKTDAAKILHIDTPQIYKAVSSQLDVFLCGRMHPSIFAAASGTPVVGLAYNPKFHGFFSLLELEDYVMDVSDFVNLDLIDELTELTSRALTKKPDVTKQIEKLKDNIDSFNRLILGLES